MTDIEAVKARVRIEEVIGRTVKLVRRGREYHGLCPFHEERTPSFTVFAGSRFQCFGCGENGDVIDFVRKSRGCSLVEALEYLGADRQDERPPEMPVLPKEPEYQSADPPPDAPAPPLPDGATIYPYCDETGRPMSYVVRIEATAAAKKTFRGLSWSSAGQWAWKHPTGPRRLYGLDLLAARPAAPVLICEGEKATHAARELFPDFVVTTWLGGSSAVQKADWSVLNGRDVTVWPDADEAGLKAAQALQDKFPTAAIVDTDGLPPGFDAADLDAEDPHAWLHDRLRRPLGDAPADDYNGGAGYDEPPDFFPPESGYALAPEPVEVIPLGFNGSSYFYYATEKNEVCELTASAHTRAELCGMASAASYWEVKFQHCIGKGGLSWAQVADHLTSACRQIGRFDPAIVRGRGAWLENETPVLHVGDSLIVDGQRRSLRFPGSVHVYQGGLPMLREIASPLETRDAHWLVKVCKLLRWEMPASGTLFAGWIVIAPICGALEWRPSVWLSGGAGAGKTWIMDNIVSVCLSKIALYVAGNTTEPGIRRALQSDARPVIFDEAERDSAAAAARMDAIFGYQRVASSESSVEILKGDNPSGQAKSYKPRTCFLFQSINTGLTKKSDESRTTILALRDRSIDADISFDDLAALTAEKITPEFSAGLISRSVSMIPVIRENAKIFSQAVAAHLKSRRFGDQLGTLLAGAYSLHSSELVSYEKALEIVSREEWTEQAPAEEEKDEYRLLRYILSAKLKIGSNEMPVARLIEAAHGFEARDGLPDQNLAMRTLNEAGIKYGSHQNISGVFFSTNHPSLKRLLSGTEWDAAWSRSLGRIVGAVSGKEIQARFGLGHKSRATFIPLSIIDPQD